MEEYMYIAAIVGCVFGILQIILFIKLWIMTNDIRKIKNKARYYNNIKSFTSDPTDRDIIEEHLIREKWLKRSDDNKRSISITEEGLCVLRTGLIETEVRAMLNNYIMVAFSIAAFVISVLAFISKN